MKKSIVAVALLTILAVSMMSMASVSAKGSSNNPRNQPVSADTITIAYGDATAVLPDETVSGYAGMAIIPSYPHPMADQGTVSAILMVIWDEEFEEYIRVIWQIDSIRGQNRGAYTVTTIRASPVYCGYHSPDALGSITVVYQERNGFGTLRAFGPNVNFYGEAETFSWDRHVR